MSTHTGRVETWFGNPDDPSDRAYFRIQRDDRSGVYPDVETEDFGDTHHIPGSDDTDLYDGGAGPSTFTPTLYFDTRADYRAFRARIKTTGTLQILAGYLSLAGDAEWHDLNRDYERYAGVYLQRPRRVLNKVDGSVECDATFVFGVTVGGV